MNTQIIVAGHGGQGILELANYLSYYEFLEGRHVAYTPSYGPESRGGKVKCYVVISDEPIDSPVVENPERLIVMNIPSMDYVSLLRPGGLLLMNTSLVPAPPERKDIDVIGIPATTIADGITESSEGIPDRKIAANSVMFGAYLAATGEELDSEKMATVFAHFFTGRKEAYIPFNLKAVSAGYEFHEATRVKARQPAESVASQ